VDPDYAVSESRLIEWYAREPASVVIATGFIASTPEGIPTTLKRDGSDFSASIFGSLLRAGKVTIWTDVNGVYSADPRKGDARSPDVALRLRVFLTFFFVYFVPVPEAVVLDCLSYREAWEMVIKFEL
jgi:aspartokinase/homoserine dehydrogenase 1